jgi:phage baseplate assembly protein W
MTEVLHAIKYPFAVDAGGGRAAEEADYEAYIRQLIRQVLMTAPGERINRPDFGAGIRRMVFAPNNPATASLTQTLIYQALSRWLATVIKVEEVAVNAEAEKLLITVHYMVIQRGVSRILNEEVTI